MSKGFCLGISIFHESPLAGLRVALQGGFRGQVESAPVDSLDSDKESTLPILASRKFPKSSHYSASTRRGGFQVDSPVRNPVASEIARSAPPYTDRTREEP